MNAAFLRGPLDGGYEDLDEITDIIKTPGGCGEYHLNEDSNPPTYTWVPA